MVAAMMVVAPVKADDNNLYKGGLSPIAVDVSDQATGGCWTNIGEVQTYAGDQLRLAGLDVASDDIGGFRSVAQVKVVSSRDNGKCYGKIDFNIYTPVEWQGRTVMASVYSTGMVFWNYQNANQKTLEYVQTIIKEYIAALPE